MTNHEGGETLSPEQKLTQENLQAFFLSTAASLIKKSSASTVDPHETSPEDYGEWETPSDLKHIYGNEAHSFELNFREKY